jgi:glycosyltransferase involved in cell wall biosynthesis
MGRWLQQHIAEFDVAHIHGIYRYPPLVAARLARANRIPYVMRPHGSLDPYLLNKPQRRLPKRIHEWLFDFPAINDASAIHFTTKEEKALVAHLNLKAPSAIIPVGLDAKIFNRTDLDGRMRTKFGIGNRPMILFMGRLTPKKGLDISAKAFGRVRAKIPEAAIVVAGPDNEGFRPQVDKWLEDSGIHDAIFPGMVTGDDRIGLLRDADVFVLQSYTENFGISVVEASAAGTPVIISDKVNLWPDIEEYEAGLVTPCDAGAAAQAMLTVLKEKSLRARLSNGGQRLISERYSREIVVNQLKKLYSDLKRDRAKSFGASTQRRL